MVSEPKRNTDVNSLEDYVATRIQMIMLRMENRGFDPVLFEGRRSKERQSYLYGKGRTKYQCILAKISGKWAQPKHPDGIVTYTMKSKHLTGKAADIISRSKMWSNPAFFTALAEEAEKVEMCTLGFERCHVEWRG